jgi:hypothetical protein
MAMSAEQLVKQQASSGGIELAAGFGGRLLLVGGEAWWAGVSVEALCARLKL